MLLQRVLPSNHWEIIWRPKNCEHLINQYIKLSLECLGIPVVLFTLRLRWLRSMGLILRRQNLHICFHACSNLLVFFHIFSRKSKPLSCTTVLYSNSKLFSVLIPSHLLSEMFMAAYQKIGSMPTVVTTRNGSLSMGGGGSPVQWVHVRYPRGCWAGSILVHRAGCTHATEASHRHPL